MASPSTSTPAAIRTSMDDLQEFVEKNRESLTRLHEAFDTGTYVECTHLSIALLHAVLRKALWVQAQFTALASPVSVREDADFFAMLTDSRDVMPEGVHDRQLYFAAEKFGVLRPGVGQHLGKLYVRVILLERSLYSDSPSAMHPRYDELRVPAQEFLGYAEACLDELRKQSSELKRRMR